MMPALLPWLAFYAIAFALIGSALWKAKRQSDRDRVEPERASPPTSDVPMFYSAASLAAISAIKHRLGRGLSEDALAIARRAGRRTVTEDDVLAALQGTVLFDPDPHAPAADPSEREADAPPAPLQ